MEPLLPVTWLWPEGWSLGLRSRALGADPWGETERLPTHTHRALGGLWAAAGRGAGFTAGRPAAAEAAGSGWETDLALT